MAVRMEDVRREVEENVHFGTCELCEYVGTHAYDVYVFEDDDGKKVEIESGEWDWGDYSPIYAVNNVLLFADFFNKKEVENFDNFDEVFRDIFDEYETYEHTLEGDD